MRTKRIRSKIAAAQARAAATKGPSKRSQQRAIEQDKQLAWQQTVAIQRQREQERKGKCGAIKP